MYQVEASKALLKPRLWARHSLASAGAAQRGHAGHGQPAHRRLLGDGRDRPAALPGLLARRQPARLRRDRRHLPRRRGPGPGRQRLRLRPLAPPQGGRRARLRALGASARWRWSPPATRSAGSARSSPSTGSARGSARRPRDALISLSSAKDEPGDLLRRAPGDGQRRGDARAAGRLRHPLRRAGPLRRRLRRQHAVRRARPRRPRAHRRRASPRRAPREDTPRALVPRRRRRWSRDPRFAPAAARRRRPLDRQRLRRADLRRPAAQDRLRAGGLPAALRDHRGRLHGAWRSRSASSPTGSARCRCCWRATRCSSSSTGCC